MQQIKEIDEDLALIICFYVFCHLEGHWFCRNWDILLCNDKREYYQLKKFI